MRDFRGAMVGRADRGLFITTGTFTPAAIKEATRDGAPPIDLLDGVDLADKLKELGLGVLKETVEVVKKVDEEHPRPTVLPGAILLQASGVCPVPPGPR